MPHVHRIVCGGTDMLPTCVQALPTMAGPASGSCSQQNILLKGTTLSRLLAGHELTGFPHSLQPACIFTRCLGGTRVLKALLHTPLAVAVLALRCSQQLACILIQLLGAGEDTHLGQQELGISGSQRKWKSCVSATHLPHRTVALCV